MSTPDWDWEELRTWDLNVEQFISFDDIMYFNMFYCVQRDKQDQEIHQVRYTLHK